MNVLFEYAMTNWRRLILWTLVGTVAFFLLLFRIQSMTPQFSAGEVSMQHMTRSLHVIWNNPDYAHYKLPLWVAHKFDHHSILNARILSSLVALTMAGMFFYVVREWLSARIAIISTVIFAASSGFLLPARVGTGIILQMSLLVLFAGMLLYQTHSRDMEGWQKTAARFTVITLLALMLYVPGMIWFMLLGAALSYRGLWGVFRRLSVMQIVLLAALALILLFPLIWIGFHNTAFVKHILGFPAVLPPVDMMLENFRNILSLLAVKSLGNAELTLVGAPLLNIIEISLALLGLIAQVQRPRLRTNYFILLSLALGILLVSLGGPVTYVAIIPLIYLMVAGGIFFLLKEWFRIFPRNPVARVFGITLMVILIGFSIFYHIRAYYAAWPHNRDTRAVYNLPHP